MASTPAPSSSSPAPRCPYYEHRGSGSFPSCPLGGYCDWFRREFDPLDVACTGDLGGTHSFDMTLRRKCRVAEAGDAAWYDAGDGYCLGESQRRTYGPAGLSSFFKSYELTIGGESGGEDDPTTTFAREFGYCGDERELCRCTAAVDGRECRGCSVCEGEVDGDREEELALAYDCTNVHESLLFTCERKNALDFMFQAARVLDGEGAAAKPRKCDYFRDRSLGGPMVCTLREYCDWTADEGDPVEAVCEGNLGGRHTMTLSYNEICEEKTKKGYSRLKDKWCRDVTKTFEADGLRTVKWKWSHAFRGGLDMMFDREATACADQDGSGSTKYCSCRAFMNKQECGCQVCADQSDPLYMNFAYDCSNLEPQSDFSWHRTDNLKKSCSQTGWESDVDFLFEAEEIVPEYDPGAAEALAAQARGEAAGDAVVVIIWTLALLMIAVAFAFDVRAKGRAKDRPMRHHGLYLGKVLCGDGEYNDFMFLLLWIMCMISGASGLRLALRTAAGISCPLSSHFSIRDECEGEDELMGMVLSLTFFLVSYPLVLWDYCRCATRKRIGRINHEETVGEYMARLYAAAPASVELKIECYHLSSHFASYTSNGTTYSSFWIQRNVTHRDSEAVNVTSSFDCTAEKVGDAALDGCDLLEVRVEKLIRGDERYDAQKESFVARNEKRDAAHDFTVDVDLGKCLPGIVLRRDASRGRGDLDDCAGLLCHLLVAPALAYRIRVNSQIGTLRPQVIKQITTSD